MTCPGGELSHVRHLPRNAGIIQLFRCQHKCTHASTTITFLKREFLAPSTLCGVYFNHFVGIYGQVVNMLNMHFVFAYVSQVFDPRML